MAVIVASPASADAGLLTNRPSPGGGGSQGFVLQGIEFADHSGRAVSGAGDVNGDGFDDLIIGAKDSDPNDKGAAGETYVVFGGVVSSGAFALRSLLPRAGGDGSSGFVLKGINAGDRSGASVSGAGDINGDGIDDVVVGAPVAHPNGRNYGGQSYLLFGRTTGFAPVLALQGLLPGAGGDGSAGFVINPVAGNDASGYSVADAGDINGDGVDDLIIGAVSADPNGRNDAGESYIVFGRTTGFPAALELRSLLPGGGGDGSAGFAVAGIDEGDESGHSVSRAGDLNGDGTDDLIIGAFRADRNGHEYVGESYVVFGRTTGFPAVFSLRLLLPQFGGDGSAGFVLKGSAARDYSGYSVSAAGDVNGDGVDDVVISADRADANGQQNAGESYLLFGRTTGFPASFSLARLLPDGGGDGSAGFVLEGVDAVDRSGRSVSNAGDVNGDGIDDLIIGASGADPDGKTDAGESYVVFGRTNGFPAAFPLSSLLPGAGGDGSAGFVLEGVASKDYSGVSVSNAGDVNGDGIDDVIVGAFMAAPNGEDGAGESYVVFGRTTGFPPILDLSTLLPR